MKSIYQNPSAMKPNGSTSKYPNPVIQGDNTDRVSLRLACFTPVNMRAFRELQKKLPKYSTWNFRI